LLRERLGLVPPNSQPATPWQKMKLLLIGPSKAGKSILASFLAGMLDSTTPAAEPPPAFTKSVPFQARIARVPAATVTPVVGDVGPPRTVTAKPPVVSLMTT
jgi:GTPase SAR1 family protein